MKFARPVSFGIGLVLAQGLAYAEGSPSQRPIAFDVPPQALSSALNVFARQSDLRVVFYTDVTDRMKSAPVHGTLTPESALKLLLDGAELTYEFADDNSVQIWAPKELAARRGDGEAGRTPGSSTSSSSTESADSATPSTSALESSPARDAPITRGMPEILVKGSRSLNSDIRRTPDAAQPYVVFDRAAIERSGARSVEDFLRLRLTAATDSTNSLVTGSGTFSGVSAIDLRGLGSDETLILIDGRRAPGFTAAGSPRQPDINAIPLSAIDRIEVLPTTASGIYGGGATGGVINIVLRRDYSGLETKLTYGNAFGVPAETRRVDVVTGFDLLDGRTNFLISGTFSDGEDALLGDSDLFERGRAHILEVNRGAFYLPSGNPPQGATTNIRSNAPLMNGVRPNLTLRGSNLPVGSPYTSLPVGYAGIASDNGAALIANGSNYNLAPQSTAQSAGERSRLVAAPTIKSVSATARHRVASWLDGFVELGASDNDSSYIANSRSLTFNLAANAAGNPFNQAVTISTPASGIDERVSNSLKRRSASAGLIARLPSDWRVSTDYLWSRNEFSATLPTTQLGLRNGTGPTAAADVTSGFLPVFTGAADFSPYLLDQDRIPPAKSTTQDAALRASGPVPFVTLPGGPAVVSVLLENRREEYGDIFRITPTATSINRRLAPARSQSVESAYLELTMPFISAKNSVGTLELLELQVAARTDRYRTTGSSQGAVIPVSPDLVPLEPVTETRQRLSSTDPTVALRVKPSTDVMLRASFGEGFLPPNVNQLSPTFLPQLDFSTFQTDPLRGNEPLGLVDFTGGGNPALQPEKSRSLSAGIVLTPRFVPNLRFSADWTRINKTDAIVVGGLYQLIPSNFATFLQVAPQRVTRNTNPATFGIYGVGPITAIDDSNINVSTQRVRAYDFSLEYRVDAGRAGAFTFTSTATHLKMNAIRVIPTADEQENAGTRAALQWRAAGTVGWSYNAWSANWSTRFFDKYCMVSGCVVQLNQGSASIPSQVYHDIFIDFAPDKEVTPWGSKVELQFGINNIFDRDPPIDTDNTSQYYSTFGDPRGSNYYAAIKLTW